MVTQEEPQVSSWGVPPIPSWGTLGSDVKASGSHWYHTESILPHLFPHLLPHFLFEFFPIILEFLNQSRDVSLHQAMDHVLTIPEFAGYGTDCLLVVLKIHCCHEAGVSR